MHDQVRGNLHSRRRWISRRRPSEHQEVINRDLHKNLLRIKPNSLCLISEISMIVDPLLFSSKGFEVVNTGAYASHYLGFFFFT